MNPAHLVSPLQQIEAFLGNVKAEIRKGAVAKSSLYDYDFERDCPTEAGRVVWLGDDDLKISSALAQRLSLLTSSTASDGPIPNLENLPSND